MKYFLHQLSNTSKARYFISLCDNCVIYFTAF